MTMHLVLDIGSTEVSAGAFAGDELRARWRLRSDPFRTPDEWRVLLTGLLHASRLELEAVERVSSASVEPAVAASLLEAVRATFALDPYAVDWRSPFPIRIDLDDPTTVGPDRLANAVAAHRLHPGDALVVDLGTATTYDCVTADGAFIGGAIAPGARTAAENLITRTARLPAVGIAVPQRAVGRHTTAALESGIFFAAVDAVEGMLSRIRAEWGKSHATVIATGGLAPVLGPHCASVEHIDPDLTLVGIRLAREHLDSGGPG
jgi:type III pantothenate kinase